MGTRQYDILFNNLPARLLFPELDRRIPGKSAEIIAELKPALQALFAAKGLKEAFELVTPEKPYTVKLLTGKEFKSKRKTYNPKREVYDMLDDFDDLVSKYKPEVNWWRVGTNMAASLPATRALFGGGVVTVRFSRPDDTHGEEEAVKGLVQNFVGDEEAEEEEPEEAREAPRREAPPAPIPRGPECDKVLADAGITSRRDFLRWAVRNHPDKGGNTEVFQRVSNCVDTQYGSGRKTRRRRAKRRTTRKSRKSSSSGRA